MTCSLCDRPVEARGMCKKHYLRWWRQGNVDTDLRYRRKSDPAYNTVHTRLYRDRGKAAEYLCVDCGQQASHWSYKNGGGGGKPYSTDLNEYEPRCGSCHVKLDRPRPLCSVDGCNAAHSARGMCHKHYQRWRNNQRVANRNAFHPHERNEETK